MPDSKNKTKKMCDVNGEKGMMKRKCNIDNTYLRVWWNKFHAIIIVQNDLRHLHAHALAIPLHQISEVKSFIWIAANENGPSLQICFYRC